MSANKLSVPRGAIVVAALVFATLTGASVYSTWQARSNAEKLLQAESQLDQFKQSQSHDGGADTASLRKLLDEKDAAYIELADKYDQLTRQTQTQQVAAARMQQTAASASGGPATRAANRNAWMERLRQQDPQRYQQMVSARQQRRQQAEQAYQDQMDDLDARVANPASPGEADLVGKISDTLDQVNQLRQKMQDLRNSSNPDDPATQAQMQQTGEQLRTAFQQLSDLRNQDRTMQYQQLATSLGLTGDKAETLATSIPQILQNTQYRPQGGGGGGPGGFFGGGPGGGGTAGNTGSSGTSQSSSPSTTTTK
jgi:hypothetical protein